MSGSNVQRAVRTAEALQDAELAEAMAELKSNPSELLKWVNGQQARVYNKVIKQKEDTFDKVYGDFDRASKVEESILMHNKRAQELSDMVDTIYKNQEGGARAVVQDKTLAMRKKEMNEWTVGNKQDTLFVFSSLFIALSGLLLITGLWRMGMISSALWTAMGIPLLLIFLLILIRRWRYTDALRNKRYWNKQIFEGKAQKITMPACPPFLTGSGAGAGAGAGAAGAAGAGAAGAGAGAGAG